MGLYEVSVSTCGRLIHGGLIVGGLIVGGFRYDSKIDVVIFLV